MDRIEKSGVGPARRDQLSKTQPGIHPQPSRAQEQSKQPIATDQVTFSEKARLVDRLKQAVDDAPDVREGKVQALRDAIENGSYKLDSREIAKHLLGLKDG